MDWTDHFTENLLAEKHSTDCRIIALESISNLWIRYAKMEINLKQFKKAVQIYDKALDDSIGKLSCNIYLSYSIFCQERGKTEFAKNILIRGLTQNFSNDNDDLLWVGLQSLLQSTSSSTVTIDSVYQEVTSKIDTKKVSFPSEIMKIKNNKAHINSNSMIEFKIDNVLSDSTNESYALTLSNQCVSDQVACKLQQNFKDIDDLSSYSPEQLCIYFPDRPQMLLQFNGNVIFSYFLFFIIFYFLCNVQ
jgi:tetratricopeptide (TPR) repeat protein